MTRPEPKAVMEAAAEALETNADGWLWGCRALAARMGAPYPEVCASVLAHDWSFARVAPVAGDPRRFSLVTDPRGGRPCVLAPLTVEGALARSWWLPGVQVDDVLALDLTPGSAWFRRAAGRIALIVGRPREGDVLQLRQDVHAFVWALAQARASAARARPLHPRPLPAGAAVLDPADLTWTKAGILKGVEAVEILDASVHGALGRALRRLNRKIGRPQVRGGVALYGAEPGGAREFGVAA